MTVDTSCGNVYLSGCYINVDTSCGNVYLSGCYVTVDTLMLQCLSEWLPVLYDSRYCDSDENSVEKSWDPVIIDGPERWEF